VLLENTLFTAEQAAKKIEQVLAGEFGGFTAEQAAQKCTSE